MPDLAQIFRGEAGRCTATLIRVPGDIDLAQDAVAEAFAVAAEQWPTKGAPLVTSTNATARTDTRTARNLSACPVETAGPVRSRDRNPADDRGPINPYSRRAP